MVIVLGAWVRLSAAGLGCPDWPGCYGHLTVQGAARNIDAIAGAFPERPFEYAKAHKEMVHRYFASGLGLIILVLAGIAIANRKDPAQPVALPIALVGLVILQGLLGMWTVTLLLKPLIVVLHLLGGLTTLALLTWLAYRPKVSVANTTTSSVSLDRAKGLRNLAFVGLIVLILQITLGGWDSHINNHEVHKSLNATLDPAFAALVRDLRERGLLEKTVVVCGGEFGRTPDVNPLGGRDHPQPL